MLSHYRNLLDTDLISLRDHVKTKGAGKSVEEKYNLINGFVFMDTKIQVPPELI